MQKYIDGEGQGAKRIVIHCRGGAELCLIVCTESQELKYLVGEGGGD